MSRASGSQQRWCPSLTPPDHIIDVSSQTYGFVEDFWAEQQAAAGGSGAKAGGSSVQQEQEQQQRLENPNNSAFIPADAVASACAAVAVMAGCDDAAAPAARKERRELLQRLGLLENVALVPAEQPLSEELLTAAQVRTIAACSTACSAARGRLVLLKMWQWCPLSSKELLSAAHAGAVVVCAG